MDCGRLTRIAGYTLAVGVLALAGGASTASAGKLQTGFLDPAAASRGGVFEINPAGGAMQAVEDAGGSIVRLYLYWRNVADSTPPANPTDPNSYNWNAGHYAVPPQRDTVWVAASYQRDGNKYRYTPGQWKRQHQDNGHGRNNNN